MIHNETSVVMVGDFDAGEMNDTQLKFTVAKMLGDIKYADSYADIKVGEYASGDLLDKLNLHLDKDGEWRFKQQSYLRNTVTTRDRDGEILYSCYRRIS